MTNERTQIVEQTKGTDTYGKRKDVKIKTIATNIAAAVVTSVLTNLISNQIDSVLEKGFGKLGWENDSEIE